MKSVGVDRPRNTSSGRVATTLPLASNSRIPVDVLKAAHASHPAAPTIRKTRSPVTRTAPSGSLNDACVGLLVPVRVLTGDDGNAALLTIVALEPPEHAPEVERRAHGGREQRLP